MRSVCTFSYSHKRAAGPLLFSDESFHCDLCWTEMSLCGHIYLTFILPLILKRASVCVEPHTGWRLPFGISNHAKYPHIYLAIILLVQHNDTTG